MSLPQYFQPGMTPTELYYSVGDRVYGTLIIDNLTVKYRFNDGSRPYEESKTFDSRSAAEKFATRFAAEMNRCDKRQTVPMISSFRSFE